MAVVDYQVEDHVAIVTLNRPEARNAINPEVAVRLAQAWQQVRDDDNVRVAIVTGTGSAFCAGADLGQLIPLRTGARQPENEWDRQVVETLNLTGRAILRNFDAEKPVIAAINGHAIAIQDAVTSLGITLRAGLHTGECEVMGDKISGIAVHIGARVVSIADPNEVLVSSTVKDLVTGSGLRFTDRGSHILKGVPGEWHLFAVER